MQNRYNRPWFYSTKVLSLLVGTDRESLYCFIRDYVYIFEIVLEVLGYICDEFPIHKSSIKQIRSQTRKVGAQSIKSNFQNAMPDVVTVHWDGNLLPSLVV